MRPLRMTKTLTSGNPAKLIFLFTIPLLIGNLYLLGGVDIELSKAEFYYINAFITETVNITGIPSTHLEGPGMQHLDGVQAVAYMRLRHNRPHRYSIPGFYRRPRIWQIK